MKELDEERTWTLNKIKRVKERLRNYPTPQQSDLIKVQASEMIRIWDTLAQHHQNYEIVKWKNRAKKERAP